MFIVNHHSGRGVGGIHHAGSTTELHVWRWIQGLSATPASSSLLTTFNSPNSLALSSFPLFYSPPDRSVPRSGYKWLVCCAHQNGRRHEPTADCHVRTAGTSIGSRTVDTSIYHTLFANYLEAQRHCFNSSVQDNSKYIQILITRQYNNLHGS